MRSDEINKNEISTEEVFTEQELSKLNETLKNNENIELPESLSKENIKNFSHGFILFDLFYVINFTCRIK